MLPWHYVHYVHYYIPGATDAFVSYLMGGYVQYEVISWMGKAIDMHVTERYSSLISSVEWLLLYVPSSSKCTE